MRKTKHDRPEKLRTLIRRLEEDRPPKSVVIGFDGYIDVLYKAVKTRRNDGEPEFYRTIEEYGQRICQAAGKSADIDLSMLSERFGGNAPLMADGMAALGNRTTLLGALGCPQTHPCFAALHENVMPISYADPCRTIALEFEDGKIMMGDVKNGRMIRWDRLRERVGEEALDGYLKQADLIAVLNWSAHAGVAKIALEIAGRIRADQTLFFDLSDPTALSESDLRSMMRLVRQIAKEHPVVLGMNENEAGVVMKKLLFPKAEEIDSGEYLRDHGEALRQKMNLRCLTIHANGYALGFDESGQYRVDGFYVDEVVCSTGAGDHYNAAFCHAYARGWPLDECLMLACAAASYYVRHSASPAEEDLAAYLQDMGDEESES